MKNTTAAIIRVCKLLTLRQAMSVWPPGIFSTIYTASNHVVAAGAFASEKTNTVISAFIFFAFSKKTEPKQDYLNQWLGYGFSREK